MTIAISVKVDDGVVLAADSAATMSVSGQTGGSQVVNIYNNARKVFRLHNSRPVGAIVWGASAIGRFSIGRLVKGFRAEVGAVGDHYTIEGMAAEFRDFIRRYCPPSTGPIRPHKANLLVAGYSAKSHFPETWEIGTGDEAEDTPRLLRAEDNPGMNFFGMPLSLERLINGYDPLLAVILDQVGVTKEVKEHFLKMCEHDIPRIICQSSMPIQDAIDLARFLADTATNFTRFCWGPNSVGGPIDIAVITQYEGFNWVSRKLFFDKTLNR